MMPAPDVESRPWAEQLAIDDASYRTQVAYLLDRSAFYRAKLAGVGSVGGLAEIAQLPFTEKRELRATCTPGTAPLLRFHTGDHVEVRTSPCGCGRTGPRVRCVGRTDDMLIVRGVNVFPSAVREVVQTRVDLVPWGSVRRSEYKSKLVEH
jgi:phenylacetate-coenzyme A ligase PaaK-like adenylate-forming protein